MNQAELIQRAVQILREGGLVAFPTETVYGLGADARNAEAIGRIYRAKGRPSTNPLIVHVAGQDVARRYAREWGPEAQRLAERFWPGPLTLVVEKDPSIVDVATAGKSTVGLRAPDHPLTLELLRRFDGPLAGPSANRSTRVSPTTAQHVREELGGAVDLILDGGPCSVGIESTVLDLTSSPARILRPGGVSRELIEREIGVVGEFSGSVGESEAASSPGQQAVHYAPLAKAFLFGRGELEGVLEWCGRHMEQSWAVMLIGRWERAGSFFSRFGEGNGRPRLVLEMPEDAADYARRLYGMLRQLDGQGVETIFVEEPPADPPWRAVRDRLRRATVPFTPL